MAVRKIFERKLPQKILLGLILNGLLGYLWPDLKIHSVMLFDGGEEHQSSAHNLPSKPAYTNIPNVKDEPHDLEKGHASFPLLGIGRSFKHYSSMFRVNLDAYALRFGSAERRRRRGWSKFRRILPEPA